jgi:hypothetical protein
MCDYIDAIHRQHHFDLIGDPLGMGLSIGVNARSEGVQVAAELERLGLIPLPGTGWNAIGMHHAVRLQV